MAQSEQMGHGAQAALASGITPRRAALVARGLLALRRTRHPFLMYSSSTSVIAWVAQAGVAGRLVRQAELVAVAAVVVPRAQAGRLAVPGALVAQGVLVAGYLL